MFDLTETDAIIIAGFVFFLLVYAWLGLVVTLLEPLLALLRKAGR